MSAVGYGTGKFETNILGCFSDCNICFLGCCCPCVLGGQNQAKSNGRECTVCDACCFSEWNTRQRVRQQFGYEQSNCWDCFCLCLFPHLVMCQDARELKHI